MTHKYKNDDKNQEDLSAPEDMLEFSEVVVFDKKNYDKLETVSYEIPIIGNIELTSQ